MMQWLTRWKQDASTILIRDVVRAADVEVQMGEYARAEELLVPYLAKHPEDTDAYMLLGRVKLEQEAWSEALSIFADVIEKEPGKPWAWALLGYAALKVGRYTIALPALQRARSESPSNEAILESLLIIAKHIDSAALRESVEKELQELQGNKAISAKEVHTHAA